MADYDELVDALVWLLTKKLQPKFEFTRGLLGDGQGVVDVPGRDGFSYVRPDRASTKVFEMFNKLAQGADGMPILIGELPWQPGLQQVLGIDWETYLQVGWDSRFAGLAQHGAEHEWRDGQVGEDAFTVYRRQMFDLRTERHPTGSMSIIVNPYDMTIDEERVSWPGSPVLDLSPARPSATGTQRYALVYWDYDNGSPYGELGVATGTLAPVSPASLPPKPVEPSSSIPSAFVRLQGGQQKISELDIVDARPLWVPNPGGIDTVRVSKLVSPDGSINPVFSADNDGHSTAINDVSADNFAFIAKNTSGATANAGDVGYIDEVGEYKTTTTANDPVSWCVVIQGGANNADIYVAVRGRATVAYTGSAPSAGDYLVTSTVAGDAQAISAFRPEVFAVCLAAGSSGTVAALLLTQSVSRTITFASALYQPQSGAVSRTDWIGTIAELPGGAAVRYSTTGGNEDILKPRDTSQLSKMFLHNTTRGDHALIDDNDETGGAGPPAFDGEITLTANVPGTWATTDVITVRSQTNTSTIGSPTAYFLDFELVDGGIDSLARAVGFQVLFRDNTAAGEAIRFHPFEANANQKRMGARNYLTSAESFTTVFIPFIARRYCMGWTASGATSDRTKLQVFQEIVAAP